jgi:hypothetical protein
MTWQPMELPTSAAPFQPHRVHPGGESAGEPGYVQDGGGFLALSKTGQVGAYTR